MRIVLLFILSCGVSFAAECRFYFADQSNWEGKLGFVFNVEATSAGSAPCTASSVKLVLGLADGTNWRWLGHQRNWELGRAYAVRGIIRPTGAELYVDGSLVSSSPGAFAPAPGDLLINRVPDWAAGTTAYYPIMDDLKVENGVSSNEFPVEGADLPSEVLRMAGRVPVSASFPIDSESPLTISTSFILRQLPDLQQASPLVDRYGQARYSPWTSMVVKDADLITADQEELDWLQKTGLAPGRDSFGGMTDTGLRLDPTGYYAVTQRNGYWWLISPEGNPVFYTGICTAPALTWDVTPVSGREWLFEELPPRTGATSLAWLVSPWGDAGRVDYVAFITWNLIRKYGTDWQRLTKERAVQRVRTWGFSGLGKWSDQTGDLPLIPVLYARSVKRLVKHIDPFESDVKDRLVNALKVEMGGRISDSRIVGWSFENEYDGIVPPDEIRTILSIAGSRPAAKVALIDEAFNAIYAGDLQAMSNAWQTSASTLNDLYDMTSASALPASDVETLRRSYMRALHKMIYEAFKTADRNHLYFGFWIVPGWWVNEEDWRIAVENCDVLGYDQYAPQFLNPFLLNLLKDTNKPTLLGEFSFPPTYGLERGLGAYPGARALDDIDSGDAYARVLDQAATEPTTIGALWFQYRDEPASGRGPGLGPSEVWGEHYAFGMVDITDRPKYQMLERMRTANLNAGEARLIASGIPAGRPPRHRRYRPAARGPLMRGDSGRTEIIVEAKETNSDSRIIKSACSPDSPRVFWF